MFCRGEVISVGEGRHVEPDHTVRTCIEVSNHAPYSFCVFLYQKLFKRNASCIYRKVNIEMHFEEK